MRYPDDYNVKFMRMPGDVFSVLRVDATGYPTIYINDQLCVEAQRRALKHELAHYLYDDFNNYATIWDAEKRAVCRSATSVASRVFRPLTEEEIVQLLIAGALLFIHHAEPEEITWEPLDMPDPLYGTEPSRPTLKNREEDNQ